MAEYDEVKRGISARFGAAAGNYVSSAVHAQGDDLPRMVELARLEGSERVLDVATGGGHTALAFAPHVKEVVASDLTPDMLAAAQTFIQSRGVENVRFELADAENMPFGDDSFDVVTCRIAAHHFPNPGNFVAEVARVLKPGGRFLLDDNIAPENPELDDFMNRYEKWRDPGHVRAHRVSKWRAMIEGSGMTVEHVEPPGRKPYPFVEWTSRIGMPEDDRDELEAWLACAPQEFKDYFEIVVEDGRVISLTGLYAILVARR
ncbi:MAG: methyltransferase domain-containing protein [Rubrobacter sp.]|nr:methyltransferase domain-containing protein [Rubrobacter sp.]